MPRRRLIGSDGVASLAADASASFDFSGLSGKTGGSVEVITTAGGLFRISLDGTNPSSTITTAEASAFGYADGGVWRMDFDEADESQTVNITAKTLLTNLTVTLYEGR